jgi:hypothetical protein
VSALRAATTQKDFRILQFPIALTPNETLAWSGFNTEQDFFTLDTDGTLRLFWRSVWVPVANLGDVYIIGIGRQKAFVVEDWDSQSLVVEKKFKLPLVRTS